VEPSWPNPSHDSLKLGMKIICQQTTQTESLRITLSNVIMELQLNSTANSRTVKVARQQEHKGGNSENPL